ncbi:MAG: phosphoribosylanthranilate isomerase [Victivallaceae bacterium]
MRVKICGIQNETELKIAVNSGADAIGFLVGQIHKSPSFILPSTAGRLAVQLPPYISPVIVTHLSEADEIMEILDKSGIYSVQLHACSPEQINKLHDLLPKTGKIIFAEYVQNLCAFPDIDELYPLIDAIVLDCYNREPDLIGGPDDGKIYEWRAGAEFISQCPLPVILAGGLSEENVAAAIVSVKPFGVDACSKLKSQETKECDLTSCTAFVRNAKNATFSLSN